MKDKLAMWVAWLLPKRVVYWCGIRIWAHATTGKNSGVEAPSVLAVDGLKMWREGGA